MLNSRTIFHYLTSIFKIENDLKTYFQYTAKADGLIHISIVSIFMYLSITEYILSTYNSLGDTING